MNQRKVTYLNVMAQYRYNVLQVLWLTGMTEQELERMVMDAGVMWLLSYTREQDEVFIREVLNEPELRSFWVHEWCARDNEQFLKSLYHMEKHVRLARYQLLHEQVITNKVSKEYKRICDGFGKVMRAFDERINKQAWN